MVMEWVRLLWPTESGCGGSIFKWFLLNKKSGVEIIWASCESGAGFFKYAFITASPRESTLIIGGSMELRKQITREYLQLRKEAKKKASIVYSRGLLVEGIGEMIVDPRGSMDLGISSREMFDFDAFWERLKQNAITPPKVWFLQRVLFGVFLNTDACIPRKKEQWESEYEHKETVTMGVDGAHLYRATLQVRSMLDGGTDESAIVWSVVPRWGDQHTVAEVHRFSGTFTSLYGHTYRALLWDGRFFSWFMDLMFGKKYIADEVSVDNNGPLTLTKSAMTYRQDLMEFNMEQVKEKSSLYL